ncbi:MAG: SIR2 family protein [Solirubrobacteraceae bacterium]
MPLDPIVSLAVALAESPGSCVCLLGAGVSADADVPTAQDILRDGLRALYRLETQTARDPSEEALAKWLKENGYEDLGYSTLLDRLAPGPAIRREMLARHFEGVEPGSAHERLADLAAAGVIKVFITTNFDRLLERAIEARGVDPVVVSDDATLAAAPRREHSRVFIIKAHGDYLQETIRNTPSELATLDPKLTEELRIIANHYGLLVLGWRGADPALAEIVRCGVTRYGSWWLSRSEQPGEPTRTVIETIGARTIVRPAGAGEFLAELQRRLSVYETYETGDHPGSIHDQVLTLLKAEDEIALDEMLRRERYAFESVVDAVRADCANTSGDAPKQEQGWHRLAAATDRRIASLIPLALHRPDLLDTEVRGHAVWASSAPAMSGLTAWVKAWSFPFWIIGMTTGGLAVRLERLAAVRPLLSSFWTDPSGYASPFIGPPGELGSFVAARFGPGPPAGHTWSFAEWQWLATDLRQKDWLVSRYPDWLKRDGEPERSLVELSILINVAAGLRDEHLMTAWWSIGKSFADGYAQRLQRDPAMRRKAAEAVGTTLEVFDERAPAILEAGPGMGPFPDLKRTADILKAGSGH